MHRKRHLTHNLALLVALAGVIGVCWPARGDLIRPRTPRTYPDIAGDIVGHQSYTFDPATRTGTFQVVNSPQFIAVGPTIRDLLNVTPDKFGTLRQTLELKLDQNGNLVPAADNRFQLHGSVVIGGQEYQGLLLEGMPTAFGAAVQKPAALASTDVFDLNMRITGGQLASAFGPEAYFRVIPQSNSTFQGSFDTDFSGDKPLTNLRALEGKLPAPVPEPSPLVVLVTGGIAAGAWRWLRRVSSGGKRLAADKPKSSSRDSELC